MKKNIGFDYELLWDGEAVFVLKGSKVLAVYDAQDKEVAKNVFEWCEKVYKELN